jgi:hypothetical protein
LLRIGFLKNTLIAFNHEFYSRNDTADNFVETVMNSILSQNIPNFEIIIVGNSGANAVPFDETVRHMWITRT